MAKGKTPGIISLVVVMVFLLGNVAGCGGGGEKQPIKFGVIVPLTGPCAKPGTSMKQGVELAVEEINAAGGIEGRKLQPLVEDDASVPTQSVAAAEKLTTKDEVLFVIGAYNSACVLAHMKVTEREKTPQIDPVAVAEAITSSGNKWMFRNCATNPMQVSQLCDYVFKNTAVRNMAVIHENTDYGKGIADVFIQSTQKYGGKILAVEAYNPGDTDFYAQLTRIKAANPEGLCIGGNLTEGAQICRQAKELKINAQLYAMGGCSTPEFDQLAAGANEGMIVTSYFEAESANPLARDFIAAFKKKFDKDPDMFAAASYEAVYIAKEAISKAGFKHKDLAAWRAAVRDELAKIKDLPGVQGPTTFGPDGQADKKVFIVQWTNHKKVILFPK